MPKTEEEKEIHKASVRRRRIRRGQWCRNMTEEEHEAYVKACRELELEIKDSKGRPMSQDNVVGLFGPFTDSTNKGGIIPESGKSLQDGDHRKRYNLKYAGRLGKRWSEIIQQVKNGEYTWADFVGTLSPEELARGQIKSVNGIFEGRPPEFVPRAFHDACIRELLARGKVLYKENYIKAIEAMTAIAQSTTAKESDRIKAAQFVIERLEGKAVEKIEISAADPWQSIISGIVGEVEDDQIARAQEYLGRVGGQE